MAQVINVEKKVIKPNVSGKTGTGKTTDKKPPLFRKMNYILMGAGLLFLIIGYILLTGGAPDMPEHFNEEVFNTRRLVVAPILILLGLVTEIFAIMYHPCCHKKDKQKDSLQ